MRAVAPMAGKGMSQVTVFVTDADASDHVVVMAPAKAVATNALVIALREQFGDRVRIVRAEEPRSAH